MGDCRIISRNTIELPLYGAHILSRITPAQRNSRIGGHPWPHRRVKHNVNIVAIIILQNLIRHHSLFGKRDGSPLGKAVAGGCRPVAVLGEIGVDASLAHYIIIEDIIDNLGDIFKNIPVLDEFLVVLCGTCNIKIITLAGIPFGVDPVERIADLRQDIGADGAFRPCGVDFAGCHIFNVIRKTHGHIARIFLWRSQMYSDILRNDKRNDLLLFCHMPSPLTSLESSVRAGWT